jgi:MoaA/NifB/PqqE/SkfB family radical SAM enzyme
MGRRLDLKIGFSCNNNCVFCAQAHKRKLGDRTAEELKKEMEAALEDGCDEMVFTGGEPTIRKDILELVSHARDLGYRIIQIQSNGRMFSYMGFVRKMVKAGATEFSPAIHGHIKEIHNVQTRSESFGQTLQGIKNLKALDQYVITNTVITKYNYRHLPEIAEMLTSLGVNQFQLAFVHPVGNAWKNFSTVVPKKSKVMPYVHRALDIAKASGHRPGDVMIEAFPFCFMKGYEPFCSEMFIPPAEVRDAGQVIKKFEEWRRTQGKVKFPQCKRCRYDPICEGPWKEYPEKYGSDEFRPVAGKKIRGISGILMTEKKRVSLLET